MKLFLDINSVNIHAKDNLGRTPLHGAVLERSKSTIKVLIKKGVNIHEIDNKTDSPLYLAVYINDAEVVELLIDEKLI